MATAACAAACAGVGSSRSRSLAPRHRCVHTHDIAPLGAAPDGPRAAPGRLTSPDDAPRRAHAARGSVGRGPGDRGGCHSGQTARGAPSQANVECGDGARTAAAARPWLARARVGRRGRRQGRELRVWPRAAACPARRWSRALMARAWPRQRPLARARVGEGRGGRGGVDIGQSAALPLPALARRMVLPEARQVTL